MPPTKVCPQCKTAVPVRQKAVIISFDPNESILREKAMNPMRAVESDSVKSARKAIDKLHKTCERASETRERTLHKQDKTECAWQAKSKIECTKCESETFEQTVHRQEQNRMCMAISTITCTAVLRVWHFSAFHLPVIVIYF